MSTAQLDLQLMEHFNERQRRLYAGTKALQYGYGGISKVHRELGLDFKTIRQGMVDVALPPLGDPVRKVGGLRSLYGFIPTNHTIKLQGGSLFNVACL